MLEFTKGVAMDKDAMYIIGITSTLILGVWNAVNNYRSSKRTSFINTVTTERVKWIERLRNNISSFVGLTHTWGRSKLECKDEFDVLKKIDNLRYLIRLQLNPNGKHDKKIEELIALIPNLTDPSEDENLEQAKKELIENTQLLLKEEWDKVKLESKQGDLKESI